MTRALLAAFAVVIVVPTSSSARAQAVCADYPNQAAAQRAHDTRDADGDGIYCEALPCPCLRPGRGGGGGGGGRARKPKRHAQVIDARITRVVDGDTIDVRAFGARRRFYRVRLIGIDTPETHRPGTPVECGGRQATSATLARSFTRPRDYNGNGLYDHKGGYGRNVKLITDPSQDLFDRYGRLLAYVVPRGRAMLQLGLLRAGWAKTYVYHHHAFRQVGRFRSAQSNALRARRGVYRLCQGKFHTPAR